MKSRNLVSTVNRIVIDCIALIPVTMIVLIVYGTYLENGDLNAGSMFGLFVIPLIPVILLALGLIEFCANYLKTWIISITPLILLIPAFWLDIKQGTILTITILTIVTYRVLAPLVKASIKYLKVLSFLGCSVTLMHVFNASNIFINVC